MNKILINANNVELETDISYKAIELGYRGDLYISSHLPNDFLVSKGSSKIIILRFSKDTEIYTDLFSYDGACNITYGRLVDENLQYHSLTIKKPSLVTWNKLTSNWDEITTDYDKLVNTDRNDYIETVRYRTIDGVKKKFTERVVNTHKKKKDRNIDILGNLNTSGREYRIKGEKAPYTGKYHINTKTLKVRTGSDPNNASKEMIKIKKGNGSGETRFYGDVIAEQRKYKK